LILASVQGVKFPPNDWKRHIFMEENMTPFHLGLKRHFGKLKDPRLKRRRKHLLLDIIAIALCGVISGCNDWQQIVTFARSRRDWLKTFLRLPESIPSHDTFERVFDRLDPQAFQACFRAWMQALHEALGLCQIAIDGKTLRGSAAGSLKGLHLVSAWATANCLSLGQVAVDEKSNEIPAIPKLLELLDVNGALVTIDAMGCQKEIAATIVAKGGDYVLTVKDNQPTLLAEIRDCFEKALEEDFAGLKHDAYKTAESGHGREETRCYYTIADPDLPSKDEWAQLRVIGMCCRESVRDGKESSEVEFFIGSRKAKAQVYGKALRNHWGIENNLHWQLDVSFAEDKNRVSKRHGAENLALVRRLALSLLKQHPDKRSMACKRLLAALDPAFLEEVIRGVENLGKV
jgi:predicted transposase YbfD/YdcC